MIFNLTRTFTIINCHFLIFHKIEFFFKYLSMSPLIFFLYVWNWQLFQLHTKTCMQNFETVIFSNELRGCTPYREHCPSYLFFSFVKNVKLSQDTQSLVFNKVRKIKYILIYKVYLSFIHNKMTGFIEIIIFLLKC